MFVQTVEIAEVERATWLTVVSAAALGAYLGIGVAGGLELGYREIGTWVVNSAGVPAPVKWSGENHPFLEIGRFALGYLVAGFVAGCAGRQRGAYSGGLVAAVPLLILLLVAVFVTGKEVELPHRMLQTTGIVVCCMAAAVGTIGGVKAWLSEEIQQLDCGRRTFLGVRKRIWLLVGLAPLGWLVSSVPIFVMMALFALKLAWYWVTHPFQWINPISWIMWSITMGLLLWGPVQLWFVSTGGMWTKMSATSGESVPRRFFGFCGWLLVGSLGVRFVIGLGGWAARYWP